MTQRFDHRSPAGRPALLVLASAAEIVASACTSSQPIAAHPKPAACGTDSPVPALPPDSVPQWVLDTTSIDSASYTRDVIDVLFREGTSQVDRERAVRLVQGCVIGGYPSSTADGYYIIYLPRTSTEDRRDRAVEVLSPLPVVQDAGKEFRGTRPS